MTGNQEIGMFLVAFTWAGRIAFFVLWSWCGWMAFKAIRGGKR